MTNDEAWVGKAWQKFCEERMPQRRGYKFPQEGVFWEFFNAGWTAGYVECLRDEIERQNNKEYESD